MKRVLLIVFLLSLLAVPAAEAKVLRWVEVCGPLDCAKTPGHDLDFAEYPLIFPPWVMSGRPDRPPERAAPWLEVHVAFARSDQVVSSVVVPRLGYAGGDQEGQDYGWVWQRLDRGERRTYMHLGRGLARFPASTLPGLD